MRRWVAWSALVIVLASASGSPCWAAKTKKDDTGKSWFSRWFGWGSKKEKAKKEARKEARKEADKAREEERKAHEADLERIRAEMAAASERRTIEEGEFLRRSQVCQELMRVAIDTQDDDLQTKVEAIEEQLWRNYRGNSAGLVSTIQSNQRAETELLKKKLGPGSREEQLDALLHTKNKTSASNTASRGGVNP